MTWRALVVPDLAGDGVAISIADRLPDGGSVAVQTIIPTLALVEEGVSAPVALRLQEDCARALYEALAVHFDTVPDSVTLQARVDQLIERVERLLDLPNRETEPQ
jgi:hypothetical protein